MVTTPADDRKWFYVHEGKPVGPCNMEELLKLFAENVIGDRTWVWQKGMPEWKAYRDVLPLDPAATSSLGSTGDAAKQDFSDRERPKNRLKRAAVTFASIAVLVALAAGLILILDRTSGESEKDRLSLAKLDALLQRPSIDKNGYFRNIKNAFPEDYAALLRTYKKMILAGHDTDAINKKGSEEAEKIRLKYIDFIKFAPDAHLKKILAHMADFYEVVYEIDGPQACNAFDVQASSTLKDRDRYSGYIKTHGDLILRGLAMGKNTPEHVSPFTPEDAKAFEQHIKDTDVPESYVKVFNGDARDDPQFCPAMVAFIRAINALDGETGHRLRAKITARIVGEK